ncbi:MAG: hypothetical protein V8S85_08020 [Oscillospiraceae bacterium]
MNRDYYDVGFEKAFPDVNGAYAMINREFSRICASAKQTPAICRS